MGCVFALPNQKLHPLSDEYIEEINRKQSTWKAGRNFEIDQYDLFKILASGAKKSNIPKIYEKIHDEAQDIPDSFDSREAWPDCADIIGLIRDQSRCGSCWAFSAVEVMSDRICIHSNATRKLLVSSEAMVACGDPDGATGGCFGGFPEIAFSTWEKVGLVTGGLYNHTEQGCQSYFLPPCDDHINKCTDYVDTPACSRVCDDPTLNYDDQKTYGQNLTHLKGEKQIQLEIMNSGPVATIMMVFMDFANYKSGIYQPTTSDLDGLHAVKIVGWGVENDLKYWLIANSWNERWGENGYFRILMGEAGIEDEASAALPDFSKF